MPVNAAGRPAISPGPSVLASHGLLEGASTKRVTAPRWMTKTPETGSPQRKRSVPPGIETADARRSSSALRSVVSTDIVARGTSPLGIHILHSGLKRCCDRNHTNLFGDALAGLPRPRW